MQRTIIKNIFDYAINPIRKKITHNFQHFGAVERINYESNVLVSFAAYEDTLSELGALRVTHNIVIMGETHREDGQARLALYNLANSVVPLLGVSILTEGVMRTSTPRTNLRGMLSYNDISLVDQLRNKGARLAGYEDETNPLQQFKERATLLSYNGTTNTVNNLIRNMRTTLARTLTVKQREKLNDAEEVVDDYPIAAAKTVANACKEDLEVNPGARHKAHRAMARTIKDHAYDSFLTIVLVGSAHLSDEAGYINLTHYIKGGLYDIYIIETD